MSFSTSHGFYSHWIIKFLTDVPLKCVFANKVISILKMKNLLQKTMISLIGQSCICCRSALYLIHKIKPAEFLIIEKRFLSPILFQLMFMEGNKS